MPSVNYFNRSAPFWDFVADLESQGSNHPLFAGRNREAGDESGPSNFPWNWVRGPTAPHFDESTHPDGPPPPFDQHDPSCDIPDPPPPPPPLDGEGPPPPPPPGPHGPHGHHGPRHWGGRRGRGGCNGRGRGGFPFGPRGGRSWGGPFGGPGGPFNLNALAEFFQEQMLGGGNSENNRNTDNSEVTRTGDDFKPLVDVFDTESSFVIHVSIPGAKKEDVAVSWDADKSELNVTGVVHRPGDEEFLKTLALDERQVGAFERKVRLGSRATPAQVDVDAITAKLEDGILRIEVPKEDRDYVDIKKVDIE